MHQASIDRINELARASRERELTAEEKAEQQQLRAEYVAAIRQSLRAQLDNSYIVRPDGTTESIRQRREKSHPAKPGMKGAPHA